MKILTRVVENFKIVLRMFLHTFHEIYLREGAKVTNLNHDHKIFPRIS